MKERFFWEKKKKNQSYRGEGERKYLSFEPASCKTSRSLESDSSRREGGGRRSEVLEGQKLAMGMEGEMLSVERLN